MRFRCPECGKPLKVADTMAGKKGRCPGCKTMVTVPRSQVRSPAIPAQGPPAPPPLPTPNHTFDVIQQTGKKEKWQLSLYADRLILHYPETDTLVEVLRSGAVGKMKTFKLFFFLPILIVKDVKKLSFRLTSDEYDIINEWIGKPLLLKMTLKQRLGWCLPIGIIYMLTSLPLSGDPSVGLEAIPFDPVGMGLGVMLIALGIYILDPVRRGKLPRVLAMSLGAGLAANGLKLLVARTRPRHFDFVATLQDTFGRWLPLGAGGSAQQSFPSAHAATAIGLAIGLGWLYPRGRWLFAALAVLVACQRMEGGNHYLSDTLVGVAIGWVVAMPFLYNAWLAAQFDRLESRSIGHRPWASSSHRSAPSTPLTYEASADEDRSRAA